MGRRQRRKDIDPGLICSGCPNTELRESLEAINARADEYSRTLAATAKIALESTFCNGAKKVRRSVSKGRYSKPSTQKQVVCGSPLVEDITYILQVGLEIADNIEQFRA